MFDQIYHTTIQRWIQFRKSYRAFKRYRKILDLCHYFGTYFSSNTVCFQFKNVLRHLYIFTLFTLGEIKEVSFIYFTAWTPLFYLKLPIDHRNSSISSTIRSPLFDFKVVLHTNNVYCVTIAAYWLPYIENSNRPIPLFVLRLHRTFFSVATK